MAQRPGAIGLLAPTTKTASTGVIPVLAVAVILAVSGCGGGTDAETVSATRPAGTATSPAGTATSTKADPSKPQSASEGTRGRSKGAKSYQAKEKQGVVLPKGSPEPAATPAERAEATIANITLSSPALATSPSDPEATLPSTYTCDGKDVSLPLTWRGVPAATAELALFVINIAPVEGALFFDWAVAGLNPSLEGLEAGQLPKDAILGRNSFGKEDYSICPSSGKPETYIFALYALPKSLSPSQGFDPATLRKQILALAGNAGLMAVSYARG